MSDELDLLIPTVAAPGYRRVWATVSSVSPVKVKLDTDQSTEVDALAAVPVFVGRRVLVDVIGTQYTVTQSVGGDAAAVLITGITGVDAVVASHRLHRIGDVAHLRFRLDGTWTPPGTWTGKLLMTLPPSARPVDLPVVAPLQFTTCWLVISMAGAVEISSGPAGTGISGTYDVRLNWITV